MAPPFTAPEDRKSTRLNSSHVRISYAVFCLKKKSAELRIAVDGGLRGLRLVLEHALPRREGGERERIAHVHFAREWQRRRLRPRAARDERRGLGKRGAHRLGNVVAVEERDEGDRFFFYDAHATEIYTLSLHDALPI